jgi:hypothetical protein
MPRSMGWIALVMAPLMLMGCATSPPRGVVRLEGPGIDATTGRPIGTETVVIGLTHAKLGSRLDRNARFWWHSIRTVGSLPRNQGYLGYSIRTYILAGEAWTVTVWQDEASMKAFFLSPTHKAAMRNGYSAMAAARFGRIVKKASDFPISWEEIQVELAKDKRELSSGYKSSNLN